MDEKAIIQLTRIADALERINPPPLGKVDFDVAEAFVWRQDPDGLDPVHSINRIDLDLLQGIERQIQTLKENTLRFAQELPANNALLWGARGTGKSSLVKSIHAHVNDTLAAQGKARGWTVLAMERSPITGPEGNVEFLLCATRTHFATDSDKSKGCTPASNR